MKIKVATNIPETARTHPVAISFFIIVESIMPPKISLAKSKNNLANSFLRIPQI
ncbi:MAG: hypothetical protein LBQ31_06005 [Bacteroidales bacterium]|nr:hypothetical protein [Bacteroidales bacterium]